MVVSFYLYFISLDRIEIFNFFLFFQLSNLVLPKTQHGVQNFNHVENHSNGKFIIFLIDLLLLLLLLSCIQINFLINFYFLFVFVLVVPRIDS